MIELSIKNQEYYKRVIFPGGKQKYFLEKTQTKLGLTLKEFADFVGICTRSMTDWKRERYSMSLPALKKLCQKSRIPLPKNIKIKDQFWYVYRGGKVGGLAVYKKYGQIGGNSEYRKKKWREWWKKEGRYRKDLITAVTKPIKEPVLSSELAEFIGILLGDGGIAPRQVTITLNRYDDKEYISFVRDLFAKLFGVMPSMYERQGESVTGIVVSRTELVNFLVKNGLKIGGKVRQQVGIPPWIKKSNSYSKACLRGLFDTDGCFYVDKHKYKDKIYLNAGMNFTNRSSPILFFFEAKLKQFGFHPTHNTKFSISLRREKDIIRYFKEIVSSNQKHLRKFKYYFRNKPGEVPKWL